MFIFCRLYIKGDLSLFLARIVCRIYLITINLIRFTARVISILDEKQKFTTTST